MKRAFADEISDTRELLLAGKYYEVIERATVGIDDSSWRESWWLLKIEAELESGQYEQAVATSQRAIEKFSTSIRVRWLGQRAYRYNREPRKAKELMDQIHRMIDQSAWRYSDSDNQIVVGHFLLAYGYDARQVLELVYDRVKREKPKYYPAFVASAELALSKQDYQVAASELQRAIKLGADGPQVHFLLARALESDDGEKSQAALQKALSKNPQHVPSLLMLVDSLIDGEQYAAAKKMLHRVFAVNQRHPLAWSYAAVIAHLEADFETEKVWREAALAWYHTNPEVDHLIGKKLSQKYRFADGAAYQRRSLKRDPNYVFAKIQLSQDLLRLGEEAEGWRLANEVTETDGYNVVAHNLVTLKDKLAKFTTLEAEGLRVRMETREAAIYGDDVLRLLGEARQVLCAKYDVKLQEPTTVEIFPQQKDFAIRTFGLPGGAGFLGVCFGRVITANSPASQGDSPSNWQSVLWHEFCHVVTLQKTKNGMPRWLSEGISVYEETLANPTWGESMNPTYRAMILGDDLTPVSQLSNAFLRPKSALHLQFAYYESALVVEYLVSKYGIETLKRVLVDLSVGMPINDSLTRYVGSMRLLDKEFAEFARSRAKEYGAKANWDEFDLPPNAPLAQLVQWNKDHPNNLQGMMRLAAAQMRAKEWSAARRTLENVLQVSADDSTGVFPLLIRVVRQLQDSAAEEKILVQWAESADDALPAYRRLSQIYSEQKKWERVIKFGQLGLAVNPLVAEPHRQLAAAAEALDRPQVAISAYRSLLQLDPIDPAGLNYRLARQLLVQGEREAALRHVLLSLEEAPRYRAAHRLLLQIVNKKPAAKKSEAKKSEAKESGDQKPKAKKPENNESTSKRSKSANAASANDASAVDSENVQSKEAPSKEAPSKEAPSKEAPSKEAPSKEAPSKKAKSKKAKSTEAKSTATDAGSEARGQSPRESGDKKEQ